MDTMQLHILQDLKQTLVWQTFESPYTYGTEFCCICSYWNAEHTFHCHTLSSADLYKIPANSDILW